MFDELLADILASLIKGFPRRTTTTTKQNVDPAVYYVYSRVKIELKNHVFLAFFANVCSHSNNFAEYFCSAAELPKNPNQNKLFKYCWRFSQTFVYKYSNYCE
jgi:hypothetical protein